MSIIRRAAVGVRERRGANPSLPWGNSVPPSNSMIGGNIAGISVTQQSAVQIAAVYGCCGLLADSISTLPLRWLDGPSLATAKELDPTPLIEQPYAELTVTEWLSQFVWSLALRGNFYGLVIERDKNLYPTQIKPYSPDNVQIRRNHQGIIEYRFFGALMNPDDVIHVRYQAPPGSIIGFNPIEVMRYPFGLARAMDMYGESYFLNSATPSGVIEVDGPLDVNETKAMLRNWLAAHQGLNHANLPAILTDGAKFNPIMITPEDSQFLESRGYTESQICGRIFRVPPHMVGIVDRTTSWGSGIEQQERGYATNTLAAYIVRAERLFTSLSPPGMFANLNLTHRLRGDTLQRSQAGSLGMLAGFFCADDVRAMFDMPPVPDGKGAEFFVPINTELIEMAFAQVDAANQALAHPDQAPTTPATSAGAPPVAAKATTRSAQIAALRAEFDRKLLELRELMVGRDQQPITLNVAPPNVNVGMPPINVEPPVVNVNQPDIHVTSPNVDVHPADIRFEPTINVEAAPTPDVHVAAPTVNVAAPQLNIATPPKESRVVRDERGRIIGVEHIPGSTIELERVEEAPANSRILRDVDGKITGVEHGD